MRSRWTPAREAWSTRWIFIAGVYVRGIVRGYDAWVGVFVDRPGYRVFIFPIPCVGLEIRW